MHNYSQYLDEISRSVGGIHGELKELTRAVRALATRGARCAADGPHGSMCDREEGHAGHHHGFQGEGGKGNRIVWDDPRDPPREAPEPGPGYGPANDQTLLVMKALNFGNALLSLKAARHSLGPYLRDYPLLREELDGAIIGAEVEFEDLREATKP